MTVTKAELAESLNQKLGLNKRESKEFVELFFEIIKNKLENGHPVKLSGFGNFYLRNKMARPGRNPRTGENIPISARRVVTFRATQKMKEHIAKNSENLKKFFN